MILAASELSPLAGTVTMVSGGFDPLHPGHIRYFRAAAELGLPVLCNVSSDEWVARKHPPLLSQDERVEVLDGLRLLAYTHPEQTTTADVIRELRPRYFVKGADWRNRIPDDEREVCDRFAVELVFLETVVASSSEILRRYRERTGS